MSPQACSIVEQKSKANEAKSKLQGSLLSKLQQSDQEICALHGGGEGIPEALLEPLPQPLVRLQPGDHHLPALLVLHGKVSESISVGHVPAHHRAHHQLGAGDLLLPIHLHYQSINGAGIVQPQLPAATTSMVPAERVPQAGDQLPQHSQQARWLHPLQWTVDQLEDFRRDLVQR